MDHESSVQRLQADPKLDVRRRAERYAEFLARELRRDLIVAREIAGPMDREVLVRDTQSGDVRPMLMFGSNNYLGYANHPYVLEQVRNSLSRWGAGLGGPPLLNGTMEPHVTLQRRVAALKSKEAALLYSSGYMANIGWLTALPRRSDVIVMDERSHASLYDGAKASKARVMTFAHNNVDDLRTRLQEARALDPRDIYVVVEGVYSMDGDLAPLDRIVDVCRGSGAFIALDDAHGTGVLGPTGAGTAELFGVEDEIDLAMGTFSKALAASGAFIAASREIVDYLRFFSRPHFFSASMPPTVIAALHAGLDLVKREPQRRTRLHDNVRRLVELLAALGVRTGSQSAIVPVYVPRGIRRLSARLHRAGIFVNAIEYPAVPEGRERLRISVTSDHTADDLHRLVEALDQALEAEEIPRDVPAEPERNAR